MIVMWDKRTDSQRYIGNREGWSTAFGDRSNREAHLVGSGIDAAVWREMGFSSLGQYGTCGFRGVLIKDGWKHQTTVTLGKGEALHELFVLIESVQ